MKIEDRLEPSAAFLYKNGLGSSSLINTAALSQAISLKRIADSLEKLTTTGGGSTAFQMGYDFGAGIEQVGFSIGQQIQRGQLVG